MPSLVGPADEDHFPAQLDDLPFTALPDLAARRVGGAAVAANDDLFADRQNLVVDAAPTFAPGVFGHQGQVMDGWESRRRREPGHDWAVVRLGLPGLVRGVVVDTSFFRGNFPPEISVEGAAVDGYPAPDELAAAEWAPLVPRSPVAGDARNEFAVDHPSWVTHVRLCQYPDGGVARLRVHGLPVPDPRRLVAGGLDLAALSSGGRVTGCSDLFYSPPANLISPGEARTMADGWETARRRDDGNDWVELELAGPGVPELAELDTTHFVGNAPGWAMLRGYDGRTGSRPDRLDDWVEVLPRTRLQPDTRHRIRLAGDREVTHCRLDIYPDGGMARLRLFGGLTTEGAAELGLRWFDVLPDELARIVLAAAGLDAGEVDAGLANRPLRGSVGAPPGLLTALAVR